MRQLFVGPSYQLAVRKLSAQRTINMHLQATETDEKAQYTLHSVPGQLLRISLGAAIRGAWKTSQGRGFIVAGDTLYEVFADWSTEIRGTLLTSVGPVRMADGNTQLVIVDGPNGYVLKLGSDEFAQITSEAWLGSRVVIFTNNYFLFVKPDSGVYYCSNIDDASDINALDFASAEYKADNLSAILGDNEDIRLLGTESGQIAYSNPQADNFPFAVRTGASKDVGCIATYSAGNADTASFWIGGDRNGGGIVYLSRAYKSDRISTVAIEEALRKSTDLSAAFAYAYQRNGLTFICFNAPGLETTLCYEISAGQWHERAEIDAYGEYVPSRVTCHVYLFGKNLVGDSDGNFSELDEDTWQIVGRPLVRERVSPHDTKPGLAQQFIPQFVLDAETGGAPIGVNPQVELSYSKDSGATWSNPVLRSLGKIGQRISRVVWRDVGRARDRIWRLRFSANAPFTIINAGPTGKTDG